MAVSLFHAELSVAQNRRRLDVFGILAYENGLADRFERMINTIASSVKFAIPPGFISRYRHGLTFST